MEEEKKTEPSVANSLIEQAKAIAVQMKAENDRREALIKREEELQAVRMLSGETHAGSEPKQETQEDKWKREAKVRYAGTGLDPTPREK